MKYRRSFALTILCFAMAGLFGTAQAANTDGTVTFSVTTAAYSGNYNPNNVAVVWVVNSSNQFVKTLCRHARTRINYLSQWIASRGTYTNVDGVSGATLSSQPQTHAVTWNCRDINEAVVPDGVYYFRTEYTSANGQGPYTTNWCRFVKGTTAVTTNFPNLSAGGGQFTGMTLSYTPASPTAGDLAVTAMAPSAGAVNSNVVVQVTVANLSVNAASFSVVLSNVTAAATLIGSQPVSALAGGASTTVSFNWNTTGLAAGLYRLKAVAGPMAGEINTANNTMTNAVTLRTSVHDVAVNSLAAPASVPPTVVTNVSVGVANAGDFSESFLLTLSDTTAGRTIGTRTIAGLAAAASTNIAFTWSATNLAAGVHTLQATAATVAGETNTANNMRTAPVSVAVNLETNNWVARGSTWKYLDTGADISGSPWMKPGSGYYDGFWAAGPAPLGYGRPDIRTTVSYGNDPANRRMTTYFRREFTVDVMPLTVIGQVQRDDGVVLYLNGVEIARQNMPAGTPAYATAATTNVSGANATNHFSFAIAPSNLVVGRNVFAAEVHQSAPTNATLGFDLELVGVNPPTPRAYRIAPVSVTPDGSVQAGDTLGVSIALFNPGNASTAFTVLLKDATTGAIVASQQVDALAPGESTVAHLTWSTLGAAAASHTLQAMTVYNGATNVADIATASVSIAAPAFVTRKVNAAGSIGGRCGAVAAAGNYAYLGCGATLEIWDGSVPSNATRVGQLSLPGNILDLAAGTGWVYAASGAAGVHVVDVRNPAAPVHSITFDSSGNARRLRLSGNLLYLADGLGGLRVLDVSNPAAPTLVGAYQTAGPAQAIAVNGQSVTVLDGHEGVQMLTATNPAAPKFAGAYRRITAGLDLATVSGVALASDGNGYLYRINTTVPATPTLATSVLLPAAGRGLALTGQALYIAAGAAGLLTVNPSTLAVLAANPISGGDAADVAVSPSGQTLYVAAGFGGCQAWDIRTPTAPRLLSTFRAGGRPVEAAASGSTLFVAADEGGLQIHNMANPALPLLLATVSSVTNVRCITLSGSLAFAADASGRLSILTVPQTGAPVLTGSYQASGLGMIRRLVVSNGRAVITDGNAIQLISVANPASPSLLASRVPGGFVFDLAVTTSQVFAACGGAGLQVFNLANLSVAGSYATRGPALGISIDGNNAHVANGASGWQTLNIANPAVPTLVQTSGGASFGVAAGSSRVSLIDGQSGMRVMNVSTPQTPVTNRVFAGLTQPLRIGAAQNLMLASEDEAGLAILDSAQTELNVSVTKLAANSFAGQNATNLSFEIWNSGPGALTYNVSDNTTRLSVSPSSGTSTGEHDTITVSFNTASVAAGTYNSTITVTSTNGVGSPKTIEVTLTVASSAPVLSVAPSSLSANSFAGQNATNLTFKIWNSGRGTVNYTVRDNTSRLSVSPTSGRSTGELDTITVSFNTASLSAGTYNSTITVTSTNGAGSTKTVPVTLTVASSAPVLSVAPVSLNANSLAGRNAPNLTFEVWNSGRGTLNYTVRDNTSRLSVSPTSGTSTGEHDIITVRFNTASVAAGTYNSTITVTSTNGTGSPKTIPITLTVAANNDDDDDERDVRSAASLTKAVATPAQAWTSSDQSDATPAASLIDGTTNTPWIGSATGEPWRATVDLGRVADVTNIEVPFAGAAWTNMAVIVSKDGNTWIDYRSATDQRMLVRYIYLYMWGRDHGTNPPAVQEIRWQEPHIGN
jgi:hypothetical protein